MGAGDAFTAVPYIAVVVKDDYHNIITPTESMKKEYLNMSSTPEEQWELQFKALTSAQMNAIKDHYDDQYGGYAEFSWQSVPSYINSGANMTGRWVDRSFKQTPNSNKWNVSITFEKSP